MRSRADAVEPRAQTTSILAITRAPPFRCGMAEEEGCGTGGLHGRNATSAEFHVKRQCRLGRMSTETR